MSVPGRASEVQKISPPEYRPNGFNQLFRTFALADEAGTAGVSRRRADILCIEKGKDDDFGRRVHKAELADYGPAVLPPELQIEKHNIWAQFCDKIHGFVRGR